MEESISRSTVLGHYTQKYCVRTVYLEVRGQDSIPRSSEEYTTVKQEIVSTGGLGERWTWHCETVRQVRLDWKKSYAIVKPSNRGLRTRKQTWPNTVKKCMEGSQFSTSASGRRSKETVKVLTSCYVQDHLREQQY